jgi:UDP-GlcNAc:undecaprenyl-phosphate GlcNAc-1-phosphate transferase
MYQSNFIYLFLVVIFINIFVIKYWAGFSKYFNIDNYGSVQKIHKKPTPRLAGLISFIYILLYVILFNNSSSFLFYKIIVLGFLPLAIISIKEDIFHNTRPYTRLLMMVISSFITFNLFGFQFPDLNIIFLRTILFFDFSKIIFFTFCVCILINGFNFIDGTNGLLGFNTLLQNSIIAFLAYQVNDIYIFNITLIFFPVLLIYILFNFPYGKIFAGDFGAYFYAFYIANITILLFYRNSELSPYYAVMILIYPAFEVFFTLVRKKIKKMSPTEPDLKHLHSKIYIFLVLKNIHPRLSNSLVCIILFPLIFFGPFSVFLLFDNGSMWLKKSSIICFVAFYLFFYFTLIKIGRNIKNP